jgi:tetratricopeptide (TPR) repeat protein/transcriptional regulator with XRE-family HTH domain
VTEPPVPFAGLLRALRTGAGLTQEELAAAAGLSPRAVSDLERGVVTTPQKETVRLLAGALQLTGWAKADFEAAARGRSGTALAAGEGQPAATRTLPRDVASFTGRQRELSQLTGNGADPAGVIGIQAIGGMAGVGKTALAVHAAHRLASRFPGGQIFLPLHGHTPGQQPVSPDAALARLLLVMGVPAALIPPDLEARTALWRDRAAGKRLLLILDDATGSDQVRPLLPGAAGCLVLVTSRRRLAALDDIKTISLDTLPARDAAELLVRLAGRPGLSAADPAVARLAQLCGYLPLAIGMLARQLHHHPAWSPGSRVTELEEAVGRLELLAAEDTSVAAAFDLSYANLTATQQRLFRRLGLHPGTEVDAYAAAALDGSDVVAARHGLEALYDRYLLTEPARGRYRMHDLIREHARTLAGRLDTDADRELAAQRLLDYYEQTAALANRWIARQTPDGRPRAGTPTASPELPGRGPALAWARAERASLLACLDQAAAAGQPTRVINLTAGLAGLLRTDGPWDEAVARHTAAVAAARACDDQPGLAGALNDLGDARNLSGDAQGALLDLQEALLLYREVGDARGQANVLTNLGKVRQSVPDYPGAARDLAEALTLARAAGYPAGQAHALLFLSEVHEHTADLPAALASLHEALAISRDLGSRQLQADVLTDLAGVLMVTGDYEMAVRHLEEGLSISREFDERPDQADALLNLGGLRRMTGDYRGAVRDLQEALDMWREIGSRAGEANAAYNLGIVRGLTGDYPAALRDLADSLAICRDIGSTLGTAFALAYLADARRATGDVPAGHQDLAEALGIFGKIGHPRGQAIALIFRSQLLQATGDDADAGADVQEALRICRDIGYRPGEADALNTAGTLALTGGDLAQARSCHQAALDLSRDLGSALDEARALAGLGRCAEASGQAADAANQMRAALDIFTRLGAAEAAELQAELAARQEER